MTTWPVLVQDWQIECCGDLFAVGDEVEWSVLLADPDGWPDDAVAAVDVTVRRDSYSDGFVLTGAPGAEIAASAERAPAADGPIRALLVEDHHVGLPASAEPLRGVVRRIRVASQEFAPIAERTLGPVRGTVRLREVDRVPAGFSRSDGAGRHEIGVVADLELR